jgi:hypothetical protein
MAYFPNQIMAKILRAETVDEVDGSPMIYNARDYNTHVRELIAIEKFIGIPGSQNTLLAVLRDALQLLRLITNEGLIANVSGTIGEGETIPMPGNVVSTTTSGTLSTGATIVNVASTDGFPNVGFATKFNKIDATTGAYNIGAKIFNSEIITYTGKTATTLTGCTRAVAGTAQAVGLGETALVVSGRAALGFGHNFVGKDTAANLDKVIVGHDARLEMFSAMYSGVTNITELIELTYSLVVVGSFEDLDITRILG